MKERKLGAIQVLRNAMGVEAWRLGCQLSRKKALQLRFNVISVTGGVVGGVQIPLEKLLRNTWMALRLRWRLAQ